MVWRDSWQHCLEEDWLETWEVLLSESHNSSKNACHFTPHSSNAVREYNPDVTKRSRRRRLNDWSFNGALCMFESLNCLGYVCVSTYGHIICGRLIRSGLNCIEDLCQGLLRLFLSLKVTIVRSFAQKLHPISTLCERCTNNHLQTQRHQVKKTV